MEETCNIEITGHGYNFTPFKKKFSFVKIEKTFEFDSNMYIFFFLSYSLFL